MLLLPALLRESRQFTDNNPVRNAKANLMSVYLSSQKFLQAPHLTAQLKDGFRKPWFSEAWVIANKTGKRESQKRKRGEHTSFSHQFEIYNAEDVRRKMDMFITSRTQLKMNGYVF